MSFPTRFDLRAVRVRCLFQPGSIVKIDGCGLPGPPIRLESDGGSAGAVFRANLFPTGCDIRCRRRSLGDGSIFRSGPAMAATLKASVPNASRQGCVELGPMLVFQPGAIANRELDAGCSISAMHPWADRSRITGARPSPSSNNSRTSKPGKRALSKGRSIEMPAEEHPFRHGDTAGSAAAGPFRRNRIRVDDTGYRLGEA
jgi:hypothetical protein